VSTGIGSTGVLGVGVGGTLVADAVGVTGGFCVPPSRSGSELALEEGVVVVLVADGALPDPDNGGAEAVNSGVALACGLVGLPPTPLVAATEAEDCDGAPGCVPLSVFRSELSAASTDGPLALPGVELKEASETGFTAASLRGEGCWLPAL
jgi:hypothetical protein